MINLLPTEKIVAFKAEYRRRRVMVLAALSLAWFIVMAFSVFALYIFARSERQLAEDRLAEKQERLNGTEAGEVNRQLSRLSDELAVIKRGESSRVLPVSFLQKVLAVKPAALRLTSLTFAKGLEAGSESSIELLGVAGTRHDLLAFLDSLRAEKTFAAVDSPVSNLIKENNVDFKIKLYFTNRHE